jgi:hypothetical protein
LRVKYIPMVIMAAKSVPGLKNILFLTIISAVVLVSGCTGQEGDVSYGRGVEIIGFESDLGSLAVESGDDVGLMLKIQNKGEVDATNVEAQLIGIDVAEWRGSYGLFDETKDLGNLMAADPVTKTEGQTKTAEWSLEAPDLPEGTDYTYEPIVRVFYNYQTKAVKPITLVDVNELKRIIQQGKSLPGESTQSSAGPLTVQIKTGEFLKTQKEWEPFPLNIIITNNLWGSGGSVIGTGDLGWVGTQWETKQYPVYVKLILPEGMSTVSSSPGCGSGDWVNLWKGGTADITCEVRIDNAPEYRVDKLIQVEIAYRYYMDASTRIKVIGTEESMGIGSGGGWGEVPYGY